MRTLTGTAVLAVAAVALTACGNVSFGSHHEDRSYTAPAIVTKLKIQTSGSRIEVTTSDSPGIKVSERLRWSNDENKPEAKHVTEGGTLKLTSKCGTQVIGIASCGVSYRVRVPRGTPVEIDNRDGAIVASGLTGEVTLHTDDGSIIAKDLSASSATLSSGDGSLRVSGSATTADLRSKNGSVEATGFTARTLTARSSDGGIRLGGTATVADLRTANGSIESDGLTTDRITARTSDGGIRLRLVMPPTKVDAGTDNGSIHLRLPATEDYAISAATDNGRKRIDSAIHEDSGSKREVKLDTLDGGITIEPN